MRRNAVERIETKVPTDPDRRRLLLAAPAVLAGAWWLAHGGLLGSASADWSRPGPRVLPLVLADLYGPHDLAG